MSETWILEQRIHFFKNIIIRLDLPCGQNPCMNGGICQVVGNSYSCQCLYPYQGGQCQTSKCISLGIFLMHQCRNAWVTILYGQIQEGAFKYS